MGVNVRIDYCSYYSCAIDFFAERPLQVNYRYFANLNELKEELLKNNRVWPPKVDRFVMWLKNYTVIADLGYLAFYNEGKIERIINIHIYYSVWLKRPVLRVAEIAEFTVEEEEEED